MKLSKVGLALMLCCAPVAAALALNLGVAGRSFRDVATGIEEGRLRPCPPDVDCVSSETEDEALLVEPLRFEGDPQEAFDSLLNTLRFELRARFVEAEPGYARAVFTTAFVKRVDELEVRLDAPNKQIHVRCFARVAAGRPGSPRARAAMVLSRWTPPPATEES